MFTRILVPTDGSDYSLRAAACAADLAKRYGAKVTALLATDSSQLTITKWPPEAYAAIKAMLDQQHDSIIARTLEQFQSAGVQAEALQVEGSPAQVIRQVAEAEGYDLIVMGSRGLNASQEVPFLGSVTERVLRLVSCPVLTVKG